VQKCFLKLLFITSVFNFSENIRMLSLHLQFLHIHRAYACDLDTYMEYTLTNCIRMLSIRLGEKQIRF